MKIGIGIVRGTKAGWTKQVAGGCAGGGRGMIVVVVWMIMAMRAQDVQQQSSASSATHSGTALLSVQLGVRRGREGGKAVFFRRPKRCKPYVEMFYVLTHEIPFSLRKFPRRRRPGSGSGDTFGAGFRQK